MVDSILGIINRLWWKHFGFVKFKCYLIIKLCLVDKVKVKVFYVVCACARVCIFIDNSFFNKTKTVNLPFKAPQGCLK